jgi:bacterioferritin
MQPRRGSALPAGPPTLCSDPGGLRSKGPGIPLVRIRTPTEREEDPVDRAKFIDPLNEDLSSEYQSIVQYNVHISTVTGPEYVSTIEELTKHLDQELVHARTLASQVAFLGGVPTTTVRDVPATSGSAAALEADLQLELEQLDRYRDRFAQANELRLADVAEALRPLLEQTQEHVKDLRTALDQIAPGVDRSAPVEGRRVAT